MIMEGISFCEGYMGTALDDFSCGLCICQIKEGQTLLRYCNPAFYEILGCSGKRRPDSGRMLGQDRVHPGDASLLKEKLAKLIQNKGRFTHTFRLFHHRENDYQWIRLEGSAKQKDSGELMLYGALNDVSSQVRMEKELAGAKAKMEDIINAIPGGVAIYRVSDISDTIYFSDGAPALTGYTVEEYQGMTRQGTAEMTYKEDTAMVVSRALQVIQSKGMDEFEFRGQHRDGHIVWVRVQIKWIGEDQGCPLLHCVFHNISDLKNTQMEMNHLINSILGGIAMFRKEKDVCEASFLSDGVIALAGYIRDEYETLIRRDALDVAYEADQKRVRNAVDHTISNDIVLDVFYRILHKDGWLVWIHMSGRRMGSLDEDPRIHLVIMGTSAETQLFQTITNEAVDPIYAIDRENYDLLYVNENETPFTGSKNCVGQKCYAALHGRGSPCRFYTLGSDMEDGREHEMRVEGSDRFYVTCFKESDWNGIPAYIKYVRDATQEVKTRREKERLEEYFQTVIKNLPGGIAVVRCERDGKMIPEYMSDGFAALTCTSLEQTWALYSQDALSGVHPDDREQVGDDITGFIKQGEGNSEIVYRLLRGDDTYVWVKNTLSMFRSEGGKNRFYAVYHDVTKGREEQEQLRTQFKERLMQHYGTTGPNALVMGHCNITRNRIIEISDHTGSRLLESFGYDRETFFTDFTGLVEDEADRRLFLDTYLNAPAMKAFQENDAEKILRCFIRLPNETTGRYVQLKTNLVDAPDTGDVTGILTVTDTTEQTINDRILHQLSATSYDLVIDLNLEQDTYKVLACNENSNCLPSWSECHSGHLSYMLGQVIVPKDREQFFNSLDPGEIRRRLEKDEPHTFSYSIMDEKRNIRTRNMTVSGINLRLGRVCLMRTDITDSVREQQGSLNITAYTFELVGIIDVYTGRLTMHTRQTVLENLPPFKISDYDKATEKFVRQYGPGEDKDRASNQFNLEYILQTLALKPDGYDFVFPYHGKDGIHYKQINVLWGDENHRAVCLVRTDVTDMLAEERRRKNTLGEVLSVAREASQAKSDFLSTMSHDIHIPMNATMGMTMLTKAHLDERERVEDCLQKVSVSSGHLLSLINDILDASKIEQSKISLSHMRIFMSGLLEKLSAIMEPQAKAAGFIFTIQSRGIEHAYYCDDSLRMSQILINLLSNVVKFAPKGGRVDFLAGEVTPVRPQGYVRYRFTVSDTGIGMKEEFLSHIFEPFIRNTARVEGTGLGFSITKGLVGLMGGDISVEGKAHMGTIFRVELECEYGDGDEAGMESSGAGHDMAAPDQIFAGRRFLIAEDNDINAEILCELLKMQGTHSDMTENGALALNVFIDVAPGIYDTVLMDIRMPKMNGYEAAQAIRRMKREDTGQVPIIAMTANVFPEDVQEPLSAGVNAHVAKPIDMEILKTVLSRALKGIV